RIFPKARIATPMAAAGTKKNNGPTSAKGDASPKSSAKTAAGLTWLYLAASSSSSGVCKGLYPDLTSMVKHQTPIAIKRLIGRARRLTFEVGKPLAIKSFARGVNRRRQR